MKSRPFPIIDADGHINEMLAPTDLSEQAKRNIMGANARAFFGLDDSGDL